ncbi:hypothetical protein NIES267_06810 [Calothrix parasitica NIES-267]|uniref:DUF3291 domain-containing protein n=1 Tax=Calothrix parasitica NIES-267 TaxID=1973488 RepID=A0A1Z4LIZ6_9CYAN|nr:hypothetical protein NIES267_06810 [Calothrix parasitica NIES-267]
MALWWLPVGDLPTVDEAKKRLQYLNYFGDSDYAFSFNNQYFTQRMFEKSNFMLNLAI